MQDEVLAAWSWPGEVRAVRHAVGLINETWWVDGPAGRFRSSPPPELAPGGDGVWADGAFA